MFETRDHLQGGKQEVLGTVSRRRLIQSSLSTGALEVRYELYDEGTVVILLPTDIIHRSFLKLLDPVPISAKDQIGY